MAVRKPSASRGRNCEEEGRRLGSGPAASGCMMQFDKRKMSLALEMRDRELEFHAAPASGLEARSSRGHLCTDLFRLRAGRAPAIGAPPVGRCVESDRDGRRPSGTRRYFFPWCRDRGRKAAVAESRMAFFLVRSETDGRKRIPGVFPASRKTLTPGSRLEERGQRFYNPNLGRWLSRDPIGEEVFFRQRYQEEEDPAARTRLRRFALNTPAYRVFENASTTFVDPDGAFSIPIAIGVGNLVIGGWYFYDEMLAPYSDDAGVAGGRVVDIREDCTIVVLFGHGDAQRPHYFLLEGNCQAAGFVGCGAGASNRILSPDMRIDDLYMGDETLGFGATSEYDETTYEYWLDKAKQGARTKADSLCKSDECRCKCQKITIYGELAGWRIDPFNSKFDSEWKEDYDCQ